MRKGALDWRTSQAVACEDESIKMSNAKLTRPETGRIGAGKAWFKMTSEDGCYFVQGNRALYSKLFRFDNHHEERQRCKVVFRPGITNEIALSEIGSGRSHSHRVSTVVKLFKEKMALREGAILERLI